VKKEEHRRVCSGLEYVARETKAKYR